MTEDFLAYIWKHQYFEKNELQTAAGEALAILATGYQNYNAGPDFQQARIKVRDLVWAGSVEFHLKASDWEKHKHVTDQKYDQVVLHVVWENDVKVTRTNGSEIPVLALKDLVGAGLLEKYQQLKLPRPSIPCEPFLAQVPEITKTMMLERTLLERLENKANVIQQNLQRTNQDWETTTYQTLLYGFGFKINQRGFEKLAIQLPYSILRKHKHQPFQTEALLFGQAGFLNSDSEDEYLKSLRKEFKFLQHKYQLPEALTAADWNFLRLRPANFPTVRLAQFSALICKHEHLFAPLTHAEGLQNFNEFFTAKPSEYWQTHYMPGKAGKIKIGSLGKSSIGLLLINAVAPLLVAFACERQQPELQEKALNLLEKLPAESNSILNLYFDLGFENKSAAHSQSLLQLHHKYCKPVNCLNCAIGNSILKRAKTN